MRPQHRLIELPKHGDQRGMLVFGQQPDHIPFPVKRFFALYDVAANASRGGHAHHQQYQFMVMLVGSATIIVDNSASRVRVRLDRPNIALHVPPMLWLDLENFSAGAVCMVLASDVYSEADYIRDRSAFLSLAAKDDV
jgi:dTDP-4-dehydrorhamnose 3,5-epimerase-like enzyme